MTEVVLRGIMARRLRTVLTALAVVLGVAMICGTFVLADTIISAYSTIFQTAYIHTDAVVVAKAPFGATGAAKQPVPSAWLGQIRAVPEVRRAHGYIDAHGQLVNAHGTLIGGSTETLVFGIPTSELDAMNPLRLIRGRWPTGSHEVVVDDATAKDNHLELGATIGIVARKPLERYRVVGVFRFGGVTTLGPTHMLALDIGVAQRIFDKQGMFDEIDIAARPGVAVDKLISALRRALPPSAQVKTARQQATDATSEVGQQIGLIRDVLLAFGGIALFVGSFIIFNTLSITVAQRTRELATLQTLGASRRQVLASILLEGAIIGVVASAIGVGLGIVVAKGLAALFAALGTQLPTAGAVFSWRTVVISLAAGVGVTLVASLAPAVQAMRVSPILAMREGAVVPPDRRGPSTPVGIAATLVVGAAAVILAATAGGLSTTTRLVVLAGGALVLFVGVAGASRWAVPPLAAAIGKLVEPFARAAGELARDNVVRMPGRTATSAAALTVGLALITFVAVLAQGLQQSIDGSIRRQVSADYVVTPQSDVLPPEVERTLRAAGVPSAGVRVGTVHAFTSNEVMTGVTPADIARFYRFQWLGSSSSSDLASIDNTGVLVARDFADTHSLKPGMQLAAETTAGIELHLVIRGIYATPRIAPLLGAMTVTTALFDRSFTTPGDGEVYVDVPAGAVATVKAALTGFPTAQLNTLGQFIQLREATVATALNLFYVLLALCVVISLFGIVNTLALSVTERTREIGVLRAIGMTRGEVARMIRIESVIIALVGAAIGILVGLVLAALSAQALSAWSVSLGIPWITLLLLLGVAVIAGTVAGILPARRAARLDPLAALSYE